MTSTKTYGDYYLMVRVRKQFAQPVMSFADRFGISNLDAMEVMVQHFQSLDDQQQRNAIEEHRKVMV